MYNKNNLLYISHDSVKTLICFIITFEMKSINNILENYYDIKDFEKDWKVYEKLGIKKFQKKIVIWIIANNIERIFKITRNQTNSYFVYNALKKDNLNEFLQLWKYNELFHASQIPFNISIIIAEALWNNYNNVFLMSWALLINTYATMLQRYNRSRVMKVLCERFWVNENDKNILPK